MSRPNGPGVRSLLLVLAFLPLLPARGEEAPAPAAGGGEGLTPKEIFATQRGQQILELFEDAVDAYQKGKFDEAAFRFEKLFELQPDQRIFVELLRRAGHRVFIEMLQQEKLENIARRFLDAADAERRKEAQDPKRIEALLAVVMKDDQTAEGLVARRRAIDSLVRMGQYVAPFVIPQFKDAKNDHVRAHAFEILQELGVEGVLPLVEGLQSKDRLVRENCAILLGLIRDHRAVAGLKGITEDPTAEVEVKRHAEKALQNITGLRLEEMRPAKEYYYLLAEDYYYENPATIKFYERQEMVRATDNQVPVWRWSDTEDGVKPIFVNQFEYNEELAEEACFDGLRLDSNYEPLIALTMSVLVSRWKETKSMEEQAKGAGAAPERVAAINAAKTRLERVKHLAMAIGRKYLYKSLERALRDGDVEVALACIEALRAVDDGEALPRPPESRDPKFVFVASKAEFEEKRDDDGNLVVKAHNVRRVAYPGDRPVHLMGGGRDNEQQYREFSLFLSLTEAEEQERKKRWEQERSVWKERPFRPQSVMRFKNQDVVAGPEGIRTEGAVTTFRVRDLKYSKVSECREVYLAERPLFEELLPGESLLVVDEHMRVRPPMPGEGGGVPWWRQIEQGPPPPPVAAPGPEEGPKAPAPEGGAPPAGGDRAVAQDTTSFGPPGGESRAPGTISARASPPASPNDAYYGRPLIDALNYPDKRVSLAAAEALVRMNPPRPFLDVEKVVLVLAKAIGETEARTILVIDNDLQYRNRLKAMLWDLNYIVYDAGTGLKGLGIARRFPGQDLIIMNADLVDMDSFELFQTLREDIRTADIPILLTVTTKTKDAAERLYEKQVQGFFPKTLLDLPIPERKKAIADLILRTFETAPKQVDNLNRTREMARFAAEAVAEIDPKRTVLHPYDAVPACLQAIERRPYRDPTIRRPCIEALGNMGIEEAIPPLIDTFKDRNAENPKSCRKESVVAIGSIIHFHRRTQDVNEFITLREALNEPDLDMREAAARALGISPTTAEQKTNILQDQRHWLHPEEVRPAP